MINGKPLNGTINDYPGRTELRGVSARQLSCELLWKKDFSDPLCSVFLSFDSKSAVTATKKGEISLLNAATGELKYSRPINASLICALVDSYTGDIFAFGQNCVSRVAADGSRVWHKTIQTPIINGALSQLSKNFIICYQGNKLVIADYNAVPKYKGSIDSKGPITSIYAPEASTNFAVVTAAGDVYYMRGDGSVMWQFCINDQLSSVSVSRDGKVIFAGSEDNKVLCLHSEQRVLFNYALKSPVVCTDISEDGKYFAVGCSDGYIYVLDSEGRTIFYDRPLESVSRVFLTESAKSILTMSGGNAVSMYRICERKTVEEKSKDFASFIEIGQDAGFASGRDAKQGGQAAPPKEEFEKFIEL